MYNDLGKVIYRIAILQVKVIHEHYQTDMTLDNTHNIPYNFD